tara:strand:- start:10176 stop:11141 length:966 start_codon:yes stop_codon:yes gene_type:complete
MPQHRVARKWRPPLALVIGGTLAAVLVLPVVGIGYFKLAGSVMGWGEAAWLIGGMALVATAILAFLLWRLVLRPVYALTAHARAMKAGRIDAPLPQHFGTPEFSDLGQSVIDMGETLHNRAARMRAYADHVTHELKSPLTAITGAAELLGEDLPAEDCAALAVTIRDAAARMELLLSDLRRHAAAGQSQARGSADLVDAAKGVTGIAVTVVQGGQVPMPAGPLTAVLAQLAQNAAAHGADRMQLHWQADVLRIDDNGTGIAPGNRAHVFEPFFTTRRESGGTGMGLSIVQALLGAHGGQIALMSEGGDSDSRGGARFEVTF